MSSSLSWVSVPQARLPATHEKRTCCRKSPNKSFSVITSESPQLCSAVGSNNEPHYRGKRDRRDGRGPSRWRECRARIAASMAGVQVPIVRPWFCLVYEQHQVAFRPVPDFRGYVKALGLATGDCFRNPPDHLAVMV